jgi:hypothetical protein
MAEIKTTEELFGAQPGSKTFTTEELFGKGLSIQQATPSFYEKNIKPTLMNLGLVQTPGERVAKAVNVYSEAKRKAKEYSKENPELEEKYKEQFIQTIDKDWDNYVEQEYGLLTETKANEKMVQLMLAVGLAPVAGSIVTAAGVAGKAALTGKLLLGLGTYAGVKATAGAVLYPAVEYIEKKIQNQPYHYQYIKSADELLPEDATQASKDIVNLIELIGFGAIAKGVMRKSPDIIEGLTKKTLTQYNMPKDVYISPEKIKSIYQTGDKISPEELDLFKSLGLTGNDLRTALSKGVNVKVPAEKVVSLVDKPYWNKIKDFFGVQSKPITTKTQAGIAKQASGELLGKAEPQAVTPTPTMPEKIIVTEPLTTGEKKVTGLSKSVEAKAIEDKLTKGFGGLSEYETINIKDQASKAQELLSQDYETAKKIAMGEVEPPPGLKSFSVYTAVENRANKEGDVQTLLDLATKSNLNVESSGAAQTLRLLAERDPESPTTVIKNLAKVREETFQKKFGKKTNVKQKQKSIANEIKENIKIHSPKREDWESFVRSLQC